MTHDETIRFEEEYLEPPTGAMGGWSGQARDDGTCAASGPCPSCHGTAYGPRTAVIGTRGLTAARPLATPCDVPCACRCGHDHGGGKDAGCGRWWIYRVANLQEAEG
jgi:hypothetical protein